LRGYAFTFFMAAFVPPLLIRSARAVLFQRAVNWAPGVIAITVSARDLLQRLDAVALEQPWTDARAREWWKLHLPPSRPNERGS